MCAMKDITIFKPTAKKAMTKTERDILFEQLKLDTGIPQYHFEAFSEIEDQQQFEKRTISNIPAIILKNNIKFIGPIIKKKTSKRFSISVQFNTSIQATYDDLSSKLIIPSNTQVELVGMYFNNSRHYFNVITLPTIRKLSSLKDKIRSGSFDLYAWYDMKNKQYEFFQSKLNTKLKEKEVIVYFSDKDKTLDILQLIDLYVNYYIDFYNDSYLFAIYTLQHHPYDSITQFTHVPTIQKKKKYPDRTPLLNFIDNIYTNNITKENNRLSILYDITSGQLWNVYQFAKIMGIDDPTTLKYIDEERHRQNNNRNIYLVARENTRHKMQYYKKLFLARSLFFKSSMNELTEKELNVVELTYQKDLEYEKHVINNKCEHLKLLKNVMQSYNLGKYFDKRSWSALKALIPKKNDTELLKCSLCELLVLCPHHYDVFEFKTSQQSENKLRLLLLRNYADTTPIEDAYYCKICGERIVQRFREEHASFISGKKVQIYRTIDTMNNKIWKEVRNIISGQLTFNIVTDVNKLTTNITETIQPFIEDELDILKNVKTNTDDIIQNTLYLYINIYAYASLIRIISHYPDDIQFKRGFKGFARKSKGGATKQKEEMKSHVNMKLLQGLFKNALHLILNTKFSLIQKIPNISVDSIKPLSIKAYKKIAELYIKTEEFNTELPPEHIANSIVYLYMFYVKHKHDTKLRLADIKQIIGVYLSDVNSLGNILEKANIPGLWKVPPPIDSPGFLYNYDEAVLFTKYAYASFLHFIKYVANRLFTMSVFNNIRHVNHKKEYETLKQFENRHNKLLLERHANILYYYYNKQYGEYKFQTIDLSKIFCPDGRKHKFNIHIYETGITRIEISQSNIDEWMFDAEKNSQFLKLVKVDLKCSVCDQYLSEVKDTPGKNSITNVLNRNDEIVAFYNLYTFKCPVKNIHIFKNDTCEQCKVTKNDLFQKKIAYYEKYKNVFYEEIKRKEPEKLRKEKKVDKKTYPQWTISNTPLVELSKITNVPRVVLHNIGLIEGKNFGKISEGSYNPIEHDDTSDNTNRILQLSSHMSTFMIEYEMLRNSRIINSQLEAFSKNWPSIDFNNFPDIYNEYNSKYSYYFYLPLGIDKMANFILISLSNALIQLYKHYPEGSDNKKAAVAFTKYIVNKIIFTEKQISDPGILRGKVADVEDEEPGDAVEADHDDMDVDIDEDYDPFSLEKSDINEDDIGENIGTADD